MEIERKFLVDKEKWANIAKPAGVQIIQAYLHNSPTKTIRVRIKGDGGFLTIKGATTGISRSEYEYKIPLQEAENLIAEFAEKSLRKLRYEVIVGNHLWEIDEFQGNLNGLILAEIELSAENETFTLPDWVTEDVSLETTYFNSQLIEKC
jgi:CYTH domain-containing protein